MHRSINDLYQIRAGKKMEQSKEQTMKIGEQRQRVENDVNYNEVSKESYKAKDEGKNQTQKQDRTKSTKVIML